MANTIDLSLVSSYAQWKSVMKNIWVLKKIIAFLTISYLTSFFFLITIHFYRSDNIELKPYKIFWSNSLSLAWSSLNSLINMVSVIYINCVFHKIWKKIFLLKNQISLLKCLLNNFDSNNILGLRSMVFKKMVTLIRKKSLEFDDYFKWMIPKN